MPAVRSRVSIFCVAVAAAACATHPTGNNPFVKGRDAGFVDIGGPVAATAATKADDEAVARAVREAQAKRAAEPPASLPVVEGRDLALKDALAQLVKTPSATAHLRVGQEYYRLGIRDLAFDHYSDALAYDRHNEAAFDGRARVWRDWGFIALALADAHRARYFHPASATARNTLGTILERQGLCREALAEYREALRLKPDAAWAQQNVTRLTDTCL
ncbi:MAG: hypothetical protein JJE40_12560 [Vicinamibacteria bacterium]|nr:hypothetical protein [Vicinamibacteria bacterium]